MKYPYTKLDIVTNADLVIDTVSRRLQTRLQTLKAFYEYDNDQVLVILQIIGISKSSYPIGMDVNDLITLIYMHHKFDLFQSKSYIYSTINRMSQTGLLEIRRDGSFDITALGSEYVQECFKK